MARVTNKGRAPVTVNAREGTAVTQVHIAPGETVDADLHDGCPATTGLVESGHLEVKGHHKPEPDARSAPHRSIKG
jgi:hypothetical protein